MRVGCGSHVDPRTDGRADDVLEPRPEGSGSCPKRDSSTAGSVFALPHRRPNRRHLSSIDIHSPGIRQRKGTPPADDLDWCDARDPEAQRHAMTDHHYRARPRTSAHALSRQRTEQVRRLAAPSRARRRRRGNRRLPPGTRGPRRPAGPLRRNANSPAPAAQVAVRGHPPFLAPSVRCCSKWRRSPVAGRARAARNPRGSLHSIPRVSKQRLARLPASRAGRG